MDSEADSYLAAVTAPFAKNAIGAQVPDCYSFPTSTQFTRCVFTINSDEVGNTDFTLMPSVYATILASHSPNSLSTGGNNVTNMGGVSNPDFTYTQDQISSMGSEVPDWVCQGVVTPDVVAQRFDQYRIVGMGARISTLVAPLQQSGRLIVGSTPSGPSSFPLLSLGSVARRNSVPAGPMVSYSEVLDWNQLPGVDSIYGPLLVPPVYNADMLTSELLNIPMSKEFAYSDLSLHGGMEWCARQTAPATLDWRTSTNDNLISSGDGAPLGNVTTGFNAISKFLNRTFFESTLISPNGISVAVGVPTGSIGDAGQNSDLWPQVGDMLSTESCALFGVPDQTYITKCNMCYDGLTTATVVSAHNSYPIWFFRSPLLTYQPNQCSFSLGNPTVGPGVFGLGAQPIMMGDYIALDGQPLGLPAGTSVYAVYYDNVGLTVGTNGDNNGLMGGGLVYFSTSIPNTGDTWYVQDILTSVSVASGATSVSMNNTCELLLSSVVTVNPVVSTPIVWERSILCPGVVSVLPSYIDTRGWSNLSVRGIGLPVNSPVFNVEVCFHLEGIQKISHQTGGFLANANKPYTNKRFHDAALEVAANMPYFKRYQAGSQAALAALAVISS